MLSAPEQPAAALRAQARLLDLAHDAILVWELQTGAIRFWNRGAERLYGWPSAEVLGRTPEAVLHTQFPQPLAEINAELIRTGRWDGELVHTRRDGTPVVVASTWALEAAAGQPRTVLGINRDVTDRKRAELALRREQEFSRYLIDSSTDGILAFDLACRYTAWNPAMERISGMPRERVLGRGAFEVFPFLRETGEDRFFRDALAGTTVVASDRPYTVPETGHAGFFEGHYAPIRDETGAVVGGLAIIRDITERKRAEDERAQLLREQAARAAAEAARHRLESLVGALSEREEQFRVTFEQAAVGMAHVGLDGRWLRVNQRLCEFLGYTAKELLARTFRDVTYPADLEVDLEQRRRRLAGEIDTSTLDKRYVRQDGALVWGALAVALVRQADGTPHYLVAVIQDIDARRRAEEQVRQHAARQAVLAEASRAFAAASLDTRALLDDIARRVGQALGDTCVVRLVVDQGPLLEPAAIYHPDPAVAALVQELLAQAPARLDEGMTAEVARTGQVVRVADISLEEQRRHIKAAYWPFLERVGASSVVLAPLRVGGRVLGTLGLARDRPGRPYTPEDAALVQDLADRAALALEAGRRFDQAVAALRARDEVLGAVSHDLRAPLTAIAGSAELLRHRLARAGVVDERLGQPVERIVGASQRMARMMDDLVDAARLEAGQPLVLQRAPTDLVALVRATVAEQATTSPHHTLEVAATEPELVGDWDAVRLRRALENLLSNAIKYSPRGGAVRVEVAAETTGGARWAVVRVADRGIGIPAADLPHVFEHFRRAGNVGTIAGTGIGLAAAWQIVRQHDGTLEVQSEEERGSTFTLRLPLPAEEGEVAAWPAPARA